jgi:hypothetical protein
MDYTPLLLAVWLLMIGTMDYAVMIDISMIDHIRDYGIVFIPDFAFKKSKNLIRSNPSSRSLCGMLIFSVLKAAR